MLSFYQWSRHWVISMTHWELSSIKNLVSHWRQKKTESSVYMSRKLHKYYVLKQICAHRDINSDQQIWQSNLFRIRIYSRPRYWRFLHDGYFDQHITTQVVEESDKENETASPIFDWFYACGRSNYIRKLSNFDASWFRALWDEVFHVLFIKFPTDRGNITAYKPMHIILAVLFILNNAGNYSFRKWIEM